MKVFFLTTFNRQIVFLLSILGFSLAARQCAAQYGAPVYTRDIKGVVLSEINKPIKNIRVIINNNDTALTDSGGFYQFPRKEFYYGERISMNFSDIDGKENGDFFSSDTILVTKPNDPIRTFLKKKE